MKVVQRQIVADGLLPVRGWLVFQEHLWKNRATKDSRSRGGETFPPWPWAFLAPLASRLGPILVSSTCLETSVCSLVDTLFPLLIII